MVALKRKKRYREEKEEERERVEVPDGNKSQSGRQAQQSIKLSSLMQCIKRTLSSTYRPALIIKIKNFPPAPDPHHHLPKDKKSPPPAKSSDTSPSPPPIHPHKSNTHPNST